MGVDDIEEAEEAEWLEDVCSNCGRTRGCHQRKTNCCPLPGATGLFGRSEMFTMKPQSTFDLGAGPSWREYR